MLLRPSLLRPLTAGVFSVGLLASMKRPILLDSYGYMPTTKDKRAIKFEEPRHSRFGGRIDYQQMAIGSFAGLFCGFIIGKMSKMLVYIAAGAFLTVQYLQTRGVIPQTSAYPLIGDSIRFLRHRFDVQQLTAEKPSFKLSFIASFVVAALYA